MSSLVIKVLLIKTRCRRRLVVPLMMLTLLLCGRAVAAGVLSAQVVSARAGLVTRAEGEVLYHCHEKGEGVAQLESGVQLHDGDLVYTGKGARVTWALNPDSSMMVAADSFVRVYSGALDRMHFDVGRGEVVVITRSLKGGAALVVHAPPGIIAVHKPGRYLFRVADGGETEALVEKGELRYEEKGKTIILKTGRKVTFRRAEKKIEHGT